MVSLVRDAVFGVARRNAIIDIKHVCVAANSSQEDTKLSQGSSPIKYLLVDGSVHGKAVSGQSILYNPTRRTQSKV